MRYISLIIIILSLALNACSKAKDEKPLKKTDTPNGGLIEVIKNGKLAAFQSVTIGEAFDSYKYLIKKDWKANILKSGHVTVDFTGWFEDSELSDEDKRRGVNGKGLEVKFVIEPNGVYYVFMVSKMELISNGSIMKSEYPDINTILKKIYSKEKIQI